MKAVAANRLPSADGNWAFEVKWDGMRVLAEVEGSRVRLWSSRGNEATISFPEVGVALSQVPTSDGVVLDGEVVAFDAHGRPDFGRLQQRMHVNSARDAARRAAEVPVRFLAFDLLAIDDTDARSLPYVDRRRLLEALAAGEEHLEVPAYRTDDGDALLAAVTAQGMEGVVAKRLDSTYLSGRRSPAWVKVKQRPHQEFVVGGWLEGEGSRGGRLGSLLVGYYDSEGASEGLRYAGRVGTGFNDAELTRLGGVLGPLERDSSPFRGTIPPAVERAARWVEPEMVVEVAFAEWTSDSVLRHPAYLGQREDKAAREVTRAP